MKTNALYLNKLTKQILMDALYMYHCEVSDKLKETNDHDYSILSKEIDHLYWTLKTQIKED